MEFISPQHVIEKEITVNPTNDFLTIWIEFKINNK